jgi:RimJ/RimL family protein N-acetyltransferase
VLQGPTIQVRRAERTDLPTLTAWNGDVEMNGEFEGFGQASLSQMEKEFEADDDERWYIVETAVGAPIGYVAHGKCGGGCWIGYQLVPQMRGRGIGTEVVALIVDYLFLHKDIIRIQAETHPANIASRRVLEKTGFTFEGLIRRSYFSRGVWRDTAMHSILREEWVGPRLLPAGYQPPVQSPA